ncbi:hypothetical protein RDV64_18195 [Acuticoccus sp. MNP-M23]|uniref:hypothetical protein n=1 Tax=Acuticoccus sp. MNP-M23 TaxID=3072793 RepID=UPI0028163836|nr:hypothetical protein [Acuticoccus sp. MNP-M23]WMS41979.1 hypothetical protein RDV64_18195 [Acuticoccus sp. MNP-M23]
MELAQSGQTEEVRNAIARYGTAQRTAPPVALTAGPLRLLVESGVVRRIMIASHEIIRGIDMPVRDADWVTHPTRTLGETATQEGQSFSYRRKFEVADGLFNGTFTLAGSAEPLTLTATLELVATRDAAVNRAGFVVLHPLKGVAGTPVERTRPDGQTDRLQFPAAISPAQPVFDIAALSHEVNGVTVSISFDGDVFEMEDQRNWTDASFKTYCRPLGLPRPYTVAAGERITQRIAMAFAVAPSAGTAAATSTPEAARAPDMEVALDESIASLSPQQAAALTRIPFVGAQVRLSPETAASALEAAEPLGLPLALDIVIPDGTEPGKSLAKVADAAAGMNVERVLALPEAYLASHQPAGPWPDGAAPADAVAAARRAFANTEIAAGMLTNFTEFNRCPPVGDTDSVSFGTTAIVHAADDTSVLETLEALPAVFDSARAHAGDRPIRLGLTTIGMRSNPYGAAVAHNPERSRTPMAMDDPRHGALFAAAFAVGVAVHAARAGIVSLAPAMASGPLGLVSDDGSRALPLFHAVRALALLSGAAVEVTADAPGGLAGLMADRPGLTGIVANLGEAPAQLTHGRAVLLSVESAEAAADPDWLGTAPRMAAPLTLAPLDVAFLFGNGDEL